MGSPTYPPYNNQPTFSGPTVTAPQSVIPQAPYLAYTQPPTMPPTPPTPPRRPVALGAVIVFVAMLAIIGVVVSSIGSGLAQARVIAYPQPVISISLDNQGQTPRVGDDLQFSAEVRAGNDLTIDWDFGDGGTAEGTSVTHVYSELGSYSVSATAYDPLGQSASASASLQVLPQPPVARFTATLVSSSDPYTYAFDASASTAGTPLSYNWNFGDGEPAYSGSSQSPTHTYQNTGSFQVTLTVTDTASQTASVTHTIKVSLPKPTAAFTTTSDPNCYGYDDVAFDASASTGYNISYSWDFGDGLGTNNYFGSSGYYYYSYSGSYLVTLTVTDPSGQTAQTQQYVYAC